MDCGDFGDWVILGAAISFSDLAVIVKNNFYN